MASASEICGAPDRDVPAIVCGYPLPCPYHSVLVVVGRRRRKTKVTEMIETYDALCLREPWLELILLGLKTLETRTRCLRRSSGVVIFVSSHAIDEIAWLDPRVGGRLDAAAKGRALSGCGKLAGKVQMGGFREGVPGVDDEAACIPIALGNGRVRQVAAVSDVKRLRREPTQRVRPDGTITAGASQGFFKVPRNLVMETSL